MKSENFESLVKELLDELPDEFAEKIKNVEFVVELAPSPDTKRVMKIKEGTMLLGLYQGIPLKHRSPTWYAGALPDRIVIYQENIESLAKTPDRLRQVLRKTLYHEIAHYFGISDKRLREIGAY